MEDQADAFQIPVNDQVYLSTPHSGDKLALVQYLNDKDITDRTLRIPSPYTLADADDFLNLTAKAAAERGYPLSFAIRNERRQLIGGCGFEELIWGHRAEIGYWLAKPFWGQGIMSDVVGALCRFAFREWKLVRITAHVFSFNLASARVLEKNGFELEGLLRKQHQKEGKFIDCLLYALVN